MAITSAGHHRSCFKHKPLYRSLVQASLAVALAAGGTQAFALSFELDNGATLDVDTTLGYDAQWRRESPSETILNGGGNPVLALLTDDGNRNFDKGDMTQNKVSFSTDADYNYGDGGIFLRARGWYDDVYNDSSLAGSKDFQQDGIDIHKSRIERLDTFLYHTFEIGDRSLNLRVGDQVVNWGESLFINGSISSAQGPLDASKANAPGVELKDIFLPIGQVFTEFNLNDALSLGAYYQYDWEPTRIDAPGTYFNVLDPLGQKSAGDPSDFAFAGFQPTAERRPDEGQWGIALRYLAENLNNTEFGLYYLRYNEFAPVPHVDPFNPKLGGLRVVKDYFEDIDLIGLSFGTAIGDTNISGEISFRDGQPVQLNAPGLFRYQRAKTVQAQLSGIYIFPQNPLADNLTFTGEIGYNRVLDIDGVSGDIGDNLDNDRGAAGFVGRLKADYFNILPSIETTSISATYRNDFQGVSAVSYTFSEGIEQLSLKADFIATGGHSFGASYVWFLTDPEEILADTGKLEVAHLNADRDYAALYYKYRF